MSSTAEVQKCHLVENKTALSVTRLASLHVSDFNSETDDSTARWRLVFEGALARGAFARLSLYSTVHPRRAA